MLKYKCLVLDHDDTVVNSTVTIHWPAFCKTLKKLRPEIRMSYEEFVMYCFEPGFHALCHDILGFSQEEMQIQVDNWSNYVTQHIPPFYDGMLEVIKRQKQEGGFVCVVSHSFSHNICRDYQANQACNPDLTFGWEYEESKRKPHPYPLIEIMKTFQLKPSDLLMVDDLKPGFVMANSCEVPFACAGWAHQNPSIIEYMSKNCNFYLSSVEELKKLIFE